MEEDEEKKAEYAALFMAMAAAMAALTDGMDEVMSDTGGLFAVGQSTEAAEAASRTANAIGQPVGAGPVFQTVWPNDVYAAPETNGVDRSVNTNTTEDAELTPAGYVAYSTNPADATAAPSADFDEKTRAYLALYYGTFASTGSCTSLYSTDNVFKLAEQDSYEAHVNACVNLITQLLARTSLGATPAAGGAGAGVVMDTTEPADDAGGADADTTGAPPAAGGAGAPLDDDWDL